ncbi:A disintegrin and metalloproteinase with thrombospondin motifs 12-like [Bombus bifarius]|uniref:A disintegrin and metalloproteinase with thrombospondin motifs 12-like n=1 Tax=Bombus bifarius TaxID=103933 RepID=A0A6P8MUC2_9HYME|nr:A disintegrin and metalloproteinase with thrombospondin motifs 12-like [Bombus bifarius]
MFRYTRDVHEPEFLIPRRVFEDGSFDTYSLPYFYDRQEINERKKRSTETGEQELEADKVHLVLPFNGIEHHVELNPYHEFISPDMVIETRGTGLRTNLNEALRFKRASDRQCHYRGFVRGHRTSKAALSLCDGVVGYVQTNHGRYFIEPVNEAEPQQDGQHVHIAYKRDDWHEKKESRDDSSKNYCGTSDDWEAAWAEQLAKRQKRLMEENAEVGKGTSLTHSIHRFVEIGLVADRRFLDFYNNSNYEQYLLTIMNMVSDFYHDRSVGNQIDMVVVRIIYLEKEKEEIDLLISPAAEATLASFAKWAQKMNPTDHTHPNHYDIAVLVTRYDICAEGAPNCNLMGLAYVGTACDPEKAACITEDSGLLLGIVISHEVGHVMGCSHDDVAISGCPPKDNDNSYFLMSPIVNIYSLRWSTCSRKYITTLLESGLGECLTDDPRNPPEKFKYPDMLPGAMYDGNFQCDMNFPGSKICPGDTGRDAMCEMLWCEGKNGSCFSRGSPMAEGSKCGENLWCIHKKCVAMGTRPTAVHGGWGKWGPMSGCSRSCGGGLKFAERECDNPPPANKGRYCIGERKKLAICNTMPCDHRKPSYRQLQCSWYNERKILTDGKHNWTAYTIHDPTLDPCNLYCINEKNVFTKFQVANDSTPCKGGTNNMCVGGTCRKVGCDWVLDSNAIDDRCGTCKGDGTKCKAIEGFFNETGIRNSKLYSFLSSKFSIQNFPMSVSSIICKYLQVKALTIQSVGDWKIFEFLVHVKIVTIPQGARSIYVAEMQPSKNVLSVRLENSETHCLNEDKFFLVLTNKLSSSYTERFSNDRRVIYRSGDYDCAGSILVYLHPEPNREEIEIKGPITTPIRIEYVFFHPRQNPGIHYVYYVMSNDPSYKPKYLWDFMEWSDCSVKCGGGTMISEAACIEEKGGKVSLEFCDGMSRPDPKTRVCNSEACPAKWRVSQWSKCNACDGKKGTRHRKVQCVRPAARAGEDDVQANLDACKGRVPKQEEECVGERPCKKTCPKKVRNANRQLVAWKEKKKQPLPHEKRAKMVDKLVDLSLAGYLEKAYGISREADDMGMTVDTADFRQLLREWSLADEEKRKRGACDRNASTPKPGSIIKDSVPVENVVLLEAPMLEEGLLSNLSDRAYQEVGDLVGGSIDTSRVKIYNGTKAVEKIEKLEGRNISAVPNKKENYSYDALSRIVDLAKRRK